MVFVHLITFVTSKLIKVFVIRNCMNQYNFQSDRSGSIRFLFTQDLKNLQCNSHLQNIKAFSKFKNLIKVYLNKFKLE